VAIERNWTGFEGGSLDATALGMFRGAILGGSARSGEFYAAHLSPVTTQVNAGQEFRKLNLTLGTGLATGEQAKAVMRSFMRLNAHVGTTNCRAGGVGAQNQQNGQLCLDTTGRFAAAAGANTIGSYSATALALGVWYRIDLTYVLTQNAGVNCTIDVTISVYTEAGTFLETVTATLALAQNATMPNAFAVGMASSAIFSTYNYDFDDWFWWAADKTDVAAVAFPTATRIARVSATGQGSSAGWTGDYRRVTDCPLETSVADEQTTSTDEATTTFLHATAAALNLGSIAGIVVRAQVKAGGGAGDEALMLNGVEYTIAAPAAYQVLARNGVDFTPYTSGQFDAMEFGARNKRGVATELGTCYLEVLHDGATTPAPFAAGTGLYRQRIVQYTGNGGYQTIAGVGFGSQVILIKRVSPPTANESGVLRLANSGGTWSRRLDQVVDAIAIMAITADGFTLGPSTWANASGAVYEALCLQDGGAHSAGFFLGAGTYVGTSDDNRAIVIPENFQPDFALIGSSSIFVMRTREMTGDFSLLVNPSAGVADRLQAFTANGFQVGTAVEVNGINEVYSWIALRQVSQLSSFVTTGKVTPTGSSLTITEVPFPPFFVLAKRNSATDAFWRASGAQAGSNSTPWEGGAEIATAITALTSDGFTGGSSLATNGVDTYWLAFAETGEVVELPPPCRITFPIDVSLGGSACAALVLP
jgi:hypothetical protein